MVSYLRPMQHSIPLQSDRSVFFLVDTHLGPSTLRQYVDKLVVKSRTYDKSSLNVKPNIFF